MEAFLISTGVVALAEIGDKTQLLALVLAAKFRRPVPIILGILAATLVNHALAGAAGAWLAATIGPTAMRWILGLSFIAMAAWTLIPDEYEDAKESPSRFGVFGTTLIAFFLLEMGDKTQIATIALAARYSSLLAVVMGTTLGMMLANVPAVLLGEVAARKLPMRLVHGIAAVIFLVLGVLVLLGVGSIASLDRRAPTALEPAIGDVTGRPEQDGPMRAARASARSTGPPSKAFMATRSSRPTISSVAPARATGRECGQPRFSGQAPDVRCQAATGCIGQLRSHVAMGSRHGTLRQGAMGPGESRIFPARKAERPARGRPLRMRW